MVEEQKNIVFRDNNPKQRMFMDAVMSGEFSVLLFGGAIRGGKTFVALAIAILLCKIFPKSRWTVVRKDLPRLRKNTRPSLDKFLEGSGWKVREPDEFIAPNGSKILFMAENFDRDKTLERFKGHETNGFILEEVSEIQEQTYHKCLERAGSYVITPKPKAGQPPPIIIMTCNPTQSWVKKLVYDPWKEGRLPKHMCYIPSYVTDNKENLDPAYLENLNNLPPYEYEVFVLGNWDVALKTPNAFWHAFEMNKHIKPVFFEPDRTVHVSIDSNSLPYCTATFWQVSESDKKIRQFYEICAEDPDNHATGLATLVSIYLQDIDYTDIVQVYGDATTKAQNTIDEKKRSFFDLFMEALRAHHNAVDRMGRKNPQVATTGEFVNALFGGFNGWSIEISETCKYSLSDYLLVKRDMEGAMQKKKITDADGNTYEEYGHISDTMRYFIYEALPEVFGEWDNRFSPPPDTYAHELEDGNIFDEDLF